MKIFKIILLLFLVNSCKNEVKQDRSSSTKLNTLDLKYAKGFTVDYYEHYKIVTITKPWPNAQKTFRYLVTSKENTTDYRTTFDALIVSPIHKLVATSTTHIPALELLNAEESLVGFPGTDYISSEKTRRRIANGNVRELGKNESLNTEVLLELNPDVVVGFGVDGANKAFEIIKKAGIPVIYNSDWVESSALAKAEWIKFFGVLFNKEAEAEAIFNQIESDYLKAKDIAKKAKTRPTVLSGAMHKEVWYLPNGSSAEGQFLKDANVNYLWSETTGNGSLALSFEVVLEKAKDAELWLSPSYYGSLKQLEEANTLYSNFEAFKTKNIYSFSNKTGVTGGVVYYELGTARPDLVLKDLIKIAHPELLEDYEPYFFEKLK